MQALRTAFITTKSFRKPSLFQQARLFSVTRTCFTEKPETKIEDFPWLLSNDGPRIPKYPYQEAPRDWSFLNILPVPVQHYLGQWLGTRILQLNTGHDNFPDQFLVGASLATRKAVSLLSDQLSHPQDEEKKQELLNLLGPDLVERFIEATPKDTTIQIEIPQIYDVNLGDIWITLGNPNAFSDEEKYDVLRWMTVQIGLHKSKVNELEEPFQEYRQRISKSIMEGVQVGVDVLIDADITFKATKEKDHQIENNATKENDDQTEINATKDDEILLYDEGRRTLRMRFATPYFAPASKMVSGREPETGEPINDWNWRLVDIDQLLEKEAMEQQ
ncbi:hypothetical protein BDF21DRAFT_448712 [Thamnidium elegans]|uniref:Uncharacterized protein n=1 Tax=Thamnidium elegans TaxID=101142 RepID=A0A8H7SUW4_9FUNG|nr:hypothetical protein INT48_004329 [Thamnidium elegans]KAI8094539.1 hypothetical protein BDF21DRAFT_448712 [Thamnidium elegans]